MELRDHWVERHGYWANGRPVTSDEHHRISLLRTAGCTCAWPLLGERPDVGPRCRSCNTVGDWSEAVDDV